MTVLIYDQTCAAEKRRRRKRGIFPDPDKRVIINELVCEGCGDCGVKSNCVSVQPLETEWGRKRTIDQSSCNKDFSCVKGFCPSFVTVHGGKLKRGTGVAASDDRCRCREPTLPAIGQTYDIIVTGVGGTGIVTIGGILGMAAHLEGKGVGVLDMAGLAQKGGAVYSHMRIAERPEDIHAIRDRGRRRRSCARRRYRGRRQQEGAGGGQAWQDRDGHQPRRVPARRFHPQRRFLAADRTAQARDPGRRRAREDALHRRDAGRDRAVRRQRRRQYLSRRLCLPARRDSARGRVDRARDRAQRRSRGHEQGRLRMGPPRARSIRPRSRR